MRSKGSPLSVVHEDKGNRKTNQTVLGLGIENSPCGSDIMPGNEIFNALHSSLHITSSGGDRSHVPQIRKPKQ